MVDTLDSQQASATRWSSLYGDGGAQFAALLGLMRAHQRTVLRVDAVVKREGLSRNAFLVLLSLRMSETGALSLGRIGKRLMVHPTTITTVVDHLEQAGLVERSPHPTDRRTVLATLTSAGETTIDATSRALREAGFGFEGVTAEQLVALARGVSAITADRDKARSTPS